MRTDFSHSWRNLDGIQKRRPRAKSVAERPHGHPPDRLRDLHRPDILRHRRTVLRFLERHVGTLRQLADKRHAAALARRLRPAVGNRESPQNRIGRYQLEHGEVAAEALRPHDDVGRIARRGTHGHRLQKNQRRHDGIDARFEHEFADLSVGKRIHRHNAVFQRLVVARAVGLGVPAGQDVALAAEIIAGQGERGIIVSGDVVRAACGTKLANVGYLTIAADGTLNTGLYTCATEGVEANITVEENAEIAAYVNQITEAFDEYLNTIVAHTDHTLTIVDAEGNRIIRNQETNLGDLVADAYRTATGADVAMVNGGGIRVTIDAGDITMNQILKAHPFGNILTMVKANGQQILDALEWTARNVPGENGGFLHVSGLTYEIHTGIESTCTSDDHGLFTGVAGEYRVKNVMINGEPLDVTKEYTVASHNYMLLEGGDGTCMFMGDEEIALPETLPDYMVVINYILNTLGGNVGEEYAAPQGRIIIAE